MATITESARNFVMNVSKGKKSGLVEQMLIVSGSFLKETAMRVREKKVGRFCTTR